jgi:pantoate--beta-alanine ligase
VRDWHAHSLVVAVVPTMGALHEGHLSLVREARARADRVIVTLFVNPRQFNNPADLAAYPRTEREDAAKLEGHGADLLYVPDGDIMYPPGFATSVAVSGLSEGLCGASRPGHFTGMATVVTKLFTQTAADLALFGEKDFQQLRIVERLARDLDLPIEVIGCTTVREADGLALSSRNTRLGPAARQQAPALYLALQTAAAAIEQGMPAPDALNAAEATMLAAGYASIDYLELRAADDLAPLTTPTRPSRLLVAAWLDGVRLIDNVPVLPQTQDLGAPQ